MSDAPIRDAFAPFQWWVWHSGYRMLTATLDDGTEVRCLAECDHPPEALDLTRSYNPLQDWPGLFQTFAETTPAEEGILRFANTYGKLGLSTRIRFLNDRKERREWPYGEVVADWQTEIQAMHQALGLWNAIQARDVQWFSDHTQIEVTDLDAIGHRKWASEIDAIRALIGDGPATLSTDASWVKDRLQIEVCGPLPIRQGNYTMVAYSFGRTYLSQMYQFQRDVITPEDVQSVFSLNDLVRLGWQSLNHIINSRLEEQTAARMRYITDDARLRIHVVPRNLLGALWLQFARGIDGQKTYLRCRGCNNWLEISIKATGYRTSRAYCSDACRSKAYRERQLRAHQLAAQGMTVEAIAHTLDTEPETVQGWLAKMPSSLETRRRGRPRKQLTSSK